MLQKLPPSSYRETFDFDIRENVRKLLLIKQSLFDRKDQSTLD